MPPESRPAGLAVAKRREADPVEEHRPAIAPAGDAGEEGEELDVLVDGEVAVEGEALREVAELAVQGPAVLPGIVAEHAHGPARGAQQPGDHPQRRRLAGAVRADQAHDLAPRDGEVDGVHRLDLAMARWLLAAITVSRASRLSGRQPQPTADQCPAHPIRTILSPRTSSC
jgi:hypothetical protein